MKSLIAAAVLICSQAFAAEPAPGTLNFNFENADITSVIKEYAKASGQKFIIDPHAEGKITVINSAPITVQEAFNQISTALAINGLAISKQNDQMIIEQARAVQRNLIDVSTELPPLHPTKMATWIVNLKYISADEVNRQLRILTSSQGEVFPFTHTNQIIISDYTPNLHRVAKLIKEIDVPAGKNAAKFDKEEKAYRATLKEKADTPKSKK